MHCVSCNKKGAILAGGISDSQWTAYLCAYVLCIFTDLYEKTNKNNVCVCTCVCIGRCNKTIYVSTDEDNTMYVSTDEDKTIYVSTDEEGALRMIRGVIRLLLAQQSQQRKGLLAHGIVTKTHI